MENPKCPYCGGEMRYAFNGDKVGVHYLICETCLSRSPAVSFNDDPYAAAMKRDRAKGKWITVSESAWEGGEYKCSACGWKCCDDEFGDDPTEDYRFCPNCGADMRKEANDE